MHTPPPRPYLETNATAIIFDAYALLSSLKAWTGYQTLKEKVAPARDKAATRNLVAVTDRRIVTARTNTFLGQGESGREIPVDRVRYVRAPAARDGNGRPVIDLITSEEIPDEERALLRQPRPISLEAGPGGRE